jgi:hypothetical protein
MRAIPESVPEDISQKDVSENDIAGNIPLGAWIHHYLTNPNYILQNFLNQNAT